MKNIRYKYITLDGVEIGKELSYIDALQRADWLNNENRTTLKTLSDWEDMLRELEPLLIAIYPKNKKAHKQYIAEVRSGVSNWLNKTV